MNESMESRLIRLLQDGKIYRIDLRIKCKTRDGMTYTLMTQACPRNVCPAIDSAKDSNEAQGIYASWVVVMATQNVLELTQSIERGDGLWFSEEELLSIRHSEIVRIWAELGDIYYDGPIEG